MLDLLSLPAPEAVTRFMQRWHGLSPGAHVVEGADRLPAALRRFYEAYGTAVGALMVNHLVAPARVEDEDGLAVFYIEEQAVYVWGVERDGEDPPVYGRMNEPGAPWRQDAPSVSVFLVQLLVTSAAMSSEHGAAAGWISREDAERALGALAPLDLPPWHWPHLPARWYAGEEAVGFVTPNPAPDDVGEPHLSVWVGALSEAGVRFLEPYVDERWDYYSPRDG